MEEVVKDKKPSHILESFKKYKKEIEEEKKIEIQKIVFKFLCKRLFYDIIIDRLPL